MNLKNLNVVELNAQEIKETEGGIWPYILGAIAIYDGVSDFWEGMQEGYGSGPKKK